MKPEHLSFHSTEPLPLQEGPALSRTGGRLCFTDFLKVMSELLVCYLFSEHASDFWPTVVKGKHTGHFMILR